MKPIQENYLMDTPPVQFSKSSPDIFTVPNSEFDCHLWSRMNTCYHSHFDYYEFCLITSGESWYYLDSEMKTTKVSSNFLLFTKKGEGHQFYPHQNKVATQFNVSVADTAFLQIAQQLNLTNLEAIPHFSVIDNSVFHYLKQLGHQIILTSDPTLRSVLARQWVTTVLLSIYDYSNNQKYPSFFADCLALLQKTSSLPMKLKELMPQISCSQATLNKYFNLYMHTTPNNYFLQLKIQHAKQLLKKSDYSMLQIASEIGFDSASHFTHLFKKMTGLTPLSYRNSSSDDNTTDCI